MIIFLLIGIFAIGFAVATKVIREEHQKEMLKLLSQIDKLEYLIAEKNKEISGLNREKRALISEFKRLKEDLQK